MRASDSEIQTRLTAILEREEFHRAEEPAWLRELAAFLNDVFGEILEVAGRFLDWLDPFVDGMPVPVRLGLSIACISVLVVALMTLRRMADARSARRKKNRQTPRHDLIAESPCGLLERARTLANDGSFRDAGRALQHAVLLNLCEQRRVAWKPTLSDWEWLKLLRPDETVVTFTRHVQLLAYGPNAHAELYAACEREAVALLRGDRVT